MAVLDLEGPAGYLAFRDTLFRKRRKRSGWQLVDGPALEGPVSDTHAHLALMSDPALSLARCAAIGLDFVCTIVDASEDGWVTYRQLDAWRGEALRVLPGVLEATRRVLQARREEAAGGQVFDGQALVGQTLNRGLGNAMAADELRANRWPCEAVSVPRVRIAAGVHPHAARRWDAEVEQQLRAMLADPRTAALGEVGLDFHYDFSPRDVQREVFRRQIALAHETGLPLVLHMREAHGEGLAILDEEGWPAAGVLLHCCTIGPDELGPWIEGGCYVAFGGAVSFASADAVRASVAIVPEARLLTETDSPYMAPVPFRGLECGPEFTVFTAQRIAEVRGAEPGPQRASLLATMHAAALELLDRDPTPWQRVFTEAAEACGAGLEACGAEAR